MYGVVHVYMYMYTHLTGTHLVHVTSANGGHIAIVTTTTASVDVSIKVPSGHEPNLRNDDTALLITPCTGRAQNTIQYLVRDSSIAGSVTAVFIIRAPLSLNELNLTLYIYTGYTQSRDQIGTCM